MRDDRYYAALVEASRSSEALEWLHQASPGSDRLLGLCGTNENSSDFIKSLYHLGAAKVWAVQIDEYPWGEQTGLLVILLPDKAEARANIFAQEAAVAERGGFESTKDLGQKLMFLKLD